MLAIALNRIKQLELAKTFQDSAEKAFAFAINADNRIIDREYRYHDSKQQIITIRYRDEPELAREFYLKAGFDLFLLTGNHDYLDDVEDDQSKFFQVINDSYWKYSPALFVELLLYGEKNLRLYKLTDNCYKTILAQADHYLQMLDDNHAYRIPWYDGSHPFTTHMSWGNVHPSRRARSFILAWRASGKTHYRDAAHLANDWHNGGNPLGVSMTSGLGHTYPPTFLICFQPSMASRNMFQALRLSGILLILTGTVPNSYMDCLKTPALVMHISAVSSLCCQTDSARGKISTRSRTMIFWHTYGRSGGVISI